MNSSPTRSLVNYITIVILFYNLKEQLYVLRYFEM